MKNEISHKLKNMQRKNEYIYDKCMDAYLNRLFQAVISREKIVIFGYHDIDGVLSISALLLVLRYLNADVEYHMPREFDSSRELKAEYIEEYIKALGTDLIITVGCGIHSCDEIQLLKDSGIDIIILDGNINNKDNTSKNFLKTQSGINEIGIYYLVFNLIKSINNYFNTKVFNKYIDLAMLGILGKYKNLNIENEKFLNNGLKLIRQTNNYGIISLLKIHEIHDVTLDDIAKLLCYLKPSINPLGKMDNSKIMVELFTTDDECRAIQIAKYISQECEQISICKNKVPDKK